MSSTRRANRLRRTVNMAAAPTDPLEPIRAKFSRLTELRRQIEEAKQLHKEYDALLEELVPSFVTRTATGWDVKSQITIGDRVYRLHPSFFNTARNKVIAKTWKSSAFPTMVIEG
jgi:hypothetical protein